MATYLGVLEPMTAVTDPSFMTRALQLLCSLAKRGPRRKQEPGFGAPRPRCMFPLFGGFVESTGLWADAALEGFNVAFG